ncbi:hypothetical protein [Pseudomonas fitomaticsae]|uniref:Uncharacterized protein n=1 Tax=Pseudomonas fitomaticsae TaxID=2837969 RepID=A0ABY3Q0Z3_9PSED|nr:hypothetical protein [Pseudomonas fitomaticsae]UFP99851.1 hypothetical protein KJY40_28230 [Pseudomonas fitomaticsae]
MQIKFDTNDLVIFASQDGTKCGGTIIGIDDIGYMLKVGPGNIDIEVVEKKSIKSAHIGFAFILLEINLQPDKDSWAIEREPYIPTPPQSIPPIWDGIAMEWYHSPYDLCNCGCGIGGNSSSPVALIGRR